MIGPGVSGPGVSEADRGTIQRIVAEVSVPVLVDADAIEPAMPPVLPGDTVSIGQAIRRELLMVVR